MLQQGWSLAVGTLSLFRRDVTQRAPQVDALGLFPQLRLSFKPSVLAAGHGVQAGRGAGMAHEPLLQKGCELPLRAPSPPATRRYRS